MKENLKKRFNEIYKGCELYAVQLNGFSHTVFYKDKDNKKHIDGFSAYSPEQKSETHLSQDGIYRSFNDEKAQALLSQFSHHEYQRNATEIVFKNVNEW
jgi:hypothetical protein